jgi:uncharacterized protein with PIN domain
MADETEQDTRTDADTESIEETETDVSEDVVVDLDSAEAYEQRIDQLQETVEEQAEQIDRLEGFLTELSARVADGRGMGVCPECNGPVEKVRRWFGPTTIECRRCGEVLHEYE